MPCDIIRSCGTKLFLCGGIKWTNLKNFLKRIEKIEKQIEKTADTKKTKNERCGRVSKNILEVHYGR